MKTFSSVTSRMQTITLSLARGPLPNAPRPLATMLGRRLALLLFFLCAALVAQPCAATPGEWEFTGSLHQGHSSHTATLLSDGKVLIAASSGPHGSYGVIAELY